MAAPHSIRIRNRRPPRRFDLRVWLVSVLGIAALTALWFFLRPPSASGLNPLPGYVGSAEAVESEYAQLYGRALGDGEALRQFRRATESMEQGEYASAAAILEKLVARVSVPAVFNDLGVLYARMGDQARALNAFRDALERDLSYEQARSNLERLQRIAAAVADPVTQEVEPNNSQPYANLVALEKPVEAAIQPAEDVDTFRFTAPPAPRDLLLLEVSDKAGELVPMARFYDGEMHFLDWGGEAKQPGALSLRFSPDPNSALYVQIRGVGTSVGAYTANIRPLRAYDAQEPNDNIMTATRIAMNRNIQANIMDARDTDYYSFVGARAGTVAIEVQNRSTTLIPALSTFTPDFRSAGFGPDVRKPGASFTHRMEVEAGKVYPLQIWSHANTTGEYLLIVKQ